MSGSDGQRQGQQQTALERQVTDIGAFLQARTASLSKVLARESALSPERLVRVAVTAMREKPALLNCSRDSVFSALMRAAELGLDPSGALGYAYLVPHKGQCVLRIGYKGMLQLAHRGGAVSFVTARLVRKDDDFSLSYEPEAVLRHVPAAYEEGDEERPPLVVSVYAAARLKTGELHVERMSVAQVEAVRRRSQAAGDGPWVTDWGQMARKTAIRRLFSYLPLTDAAHEALEEDARLDSGEAPVAGVVVDMPAHATRTASLKSKVAALPSAAAKPEDVLPAPEAVPAERVPGQEG